MWQKHLKPTFAQQRDVLNQEITKDLELLKKGLSAK